MSCRLILIYNILAALSPSLTYASAIPTFVINNLNRVALRKTLVLALHLVIADSVARLKNSMLQAPNSWVTYD